MEETKSIIVFGATGKQGGGVVRRLLAEKKFQVIAITRNPNSDAGKKLAEAGCKVVQADLTKKESLEQVFK